MKKLSLCLPAGNSYSPPSFDTFELNFVPVFPNNRATKNLIENFSNIMDQVLWHYILKLWERNAQNQHAWSSLIMEVSKEFSKKILLDNKMIHLLNKKISKKVYNKGKIILSKASAFLFTNCPRIFLIEIFGCGFPKIKNYRL